MKSSHKMNIQILVSNTSWEAITFTEATDIDKKVQEIHLPLECS